MKRRSIFTLVVALMMLVAFTTSCFAATTTTTKKPVAKKVVTPAKKVVKPAVKPAVKAAVPAAAAAAAIKAPASLTGDKAKAYALLAGCKYSGKGTGDFNAVIYEVPLLGDTDMKVKITSTGTASKMTTTDVPGIVGGDVKDEALAAVPFSELVGGNPGNLEAFLKTATVTVAGNTITVKNTAATPSFVTMLNKVSKKVTWAKAKVMMNYTISISAGKVTSVKVDTVSASCTASGKLYKAKLGGTMTY